MTAGVALAKYLIQVLNIRRANTNANGGGKDYYIKQTTFILSP